MGQLTSHILDTCHGVPAAGVRLELWDVSTAAAKRLKVATTNHDGRLDAPLLAGAAFTKATLEIRFHVGAYFNSKPHTASATPFLDIVPVGFSVTDPDSHYHIPLLVSPFSYSTYRGS